MPPASADGPDVLLSIRVDADGHGLAVGGFGVALATADGGKRWAPARLLDGEAGERHLNRIFVSRRGHLADRRRERPRCCAATGRGEPLARR